MNALFNSLAFTALGATMLLLVGALPPATAAESVRIDVTLGDVVSNSVPRLFGMGGNIWELPSAFGAGVDTRILDMPHLGVTRLSLGVQVLQAASSLQDLKQRLASLPANAFLRQYKAKGGRVLLILDGTPRWLSANKSTERVSGPDELVFNLSPPADFMQWAEVVEAVVQHFNGKLGLNAYYEVRNEPNYYYYGTNEQFFKQYYYTVLGARRADAKALVGGPGISEFMGVATAGEPMRSEADKIRITEQTLGQRYLFKQFLEYAAKTPLRELGLARLPVDFFSWHAFYFDPTSYYAAVVPYVRDALANAGYPRNVPMINSEWNIAAVPPYPEGPVNATQVGAAYVANSLMAMHESGVDLQSFQMYVDPGTQGYFGGMFSNQGVPRANFHAFNLFAMLKGRQVRVTSSDPWVKSVAFVDGDTVYLLLSSLVPSADMLKNTQPLLLALRNAEFTKSVVRERLVESVVKGQALPPAMAAQAREIEAQGERSRKEDGQRANNRRAEQTLQIVISGLGAPKQVTRYLIDSSHANVQPQMAKAARLVGEQSKANRGIPAKLNERLLNAGVSKRAADAISSELGAGKSLEQALKSVATEQRERARRVVEESVGQVLKQFSRTLQEIESWPGAGLTPETVKWPDAEPLRMVIEPHAVTLLVLQR